MHARLKRDSSNFDICKARLERIKMRAYFLEDLLNSRREHIANPGAEKSIKWSFEPPSSARTFDWYNEYRPWLMRISLVPLNSRFSNVMPTIVAGFRGGQSERQGGP